MTNALAYGIDLVYVRGQYLFGILTLVQPMIVHYDAYGHNETYASEQSAVAALPSLSRWLMRIAVRHAESNIFS